MVAQPDVADGLDPRRVLGNQEDRRAPVGILGVGIGDGGDRDMNRAVRVHGNAAESVPVALLLLLLAELNGASSVLLHACCAVFVASRSPPPTGLNRSVGGTWQPLAGPI